MNESEENKLSHWDCFSFPCSDSCCQYGADVYPHERDALISAGIARASDFTKPKIDETGTKLYRTRTRKGERGCVFLMQDRGCRLHVTGYKPSVCCEWPRNFDEAKCAAGDGYLPCFSVRYQSENNSY